MIKIKGILLSTKGKIEATKRVEVIRSWQICLKELFFALIQ